jgi:hypothetical protein
LPFGASAVLVCLILAGACATPAPTATVPVAEPALHRMAVAERDSATPSIAVSGERVVVAWSTAPPSGGMDILAAVSEDGGLTFGEPVRVNDAAAVVRVSGEQAPRVAFVGDRIAVVWPAQRDGFSEIRFATSDDHGRTFQPSRLAHAAGLAGLRGWAAAAGDGQGRLHLAWLDGRVAGVSAGAAHHHGAAAATAPRQDLYRAVIDPDGTVTEAPVTTAVCFCCKTALAGTADGAELAWRHIFPESMRDIGFASLAAGPAAATSDVVRVSADDWQIDACPDDGPSIAIADDSVRHVVWPTMVGPLNVDALDKGVFYASSADGRTFVPRVRLSQREDGGASHPYIAAAPDGRVAAVWDERANGTINVRLREKRAGVMEWSPAERIDDADPAYYPVVAAVPDAWVIAWTSGSQPQSTVMVSRVPRR